MPKCGNAEMLCHQLAEFLFNFFSDLAASSSILSWKSFASRFIRSNAAKSLSWGSSSNGTGLLGKKRQSAISPCFNRGSERSQIQRSGRGWP
jgi:hypothetical protein